MNALPLSVPTAPPKDVAEVKQPVTVRSEKVMELPFWAEVVRPLQGAAATPLPVPAMAPL